VEEVLDILWCEITIIKLEIISDKYEPKQRERILI